MKSGCGITMVPPEKGSRLGELCRQAVEILEKSGFGRVVGREEFVVAYQQSENPEFGRILVIDEDLKGRGLNILHKHGIEVDHHLVMTDLGLEEDDEVDAEALQLLRDGIEAECVEVGDQVPGVYCSCSSTF